ncbi:MAG: class B sortase [Clostridiales bacterium]|jgi:sortase B|nr:class B sortase [Clostridiales bacterium]
MPRHKEEKDKKRRPAAAFWVGKTTDTIILVALTALLSFVMFQYRDYIKVLEDITSQELPAMPAVSPTPTSGPSASPSAVPTASPGPLWVRPDFAGKREQFDNQDIIGYLDVPDTTIRYFVTQAGDNVFYLNHNIKLEEHNAGWVFLDYDNDISKEDDNTIIYGHNMRLPIMFHDLRKFRDEEFTRSHPYFYYQTLYDDYIFEVFAVFLTDTSFSYNRVNMSEADYRKLLDRMLDISMFDLGLEVGVTDRILTLSTCSNLVDDERLVVVGKMAERRSVKR